MDQLERAIRIAALAHADQLDKGGLPYILHPLRVMLAMTDEASRLVAVLHDVVEDSDDWDLCDIRANAFSPEVIEALDAITKRPDEPYRQYILRVLQNSIARTVKIADLRDNCNISRISNPGLKDLARLRKYEDAIEVLMDGI